MKIFRNGYEKSIANHGSMAFGLLFAFSMAKFLPVVNSFLNKKQLKIEFFKCSTTIYK